MTTQMIESYGIDVGYIITGIVALVIILLIMLIILMIRIGTLNKRLSKFTSGKEAKNLEGLMISKFKDIESIVNNEKKQNKDIKYIAERSTLAFNKTGLVKYNAFREMTGNLSFALAILNDNNTGVIINSMHSRDGCYTYAKEIISGESYNVLSEEEKEALELAQTIKPNLVDELLQKDRSTKTTEEINNNIKTYEKNNVKEAPNSMAKIRKPEDLDKKAQDASEEYKPTVADEANVKKFTDKDREKFVKEQTTETKSLLEEIPTKPRNSKEDFDTKTNTKLSDEIKTRPKEIVKTNTNRETKNEEASEINNLTNNDVEDLNINDEYNYTTPPEIHIKVNTSVENYELEPEKTVTGTVKLKTPEVPQLKYSKITRTDNANTKSSSMKILPSNTYDKNVYEALNRKLEEKYVEEEKNLIKEEPSRPQIISSEVIADDGVDLGFQNDIGKKPELTIKTNYDINIDENNYNDDISGIL